MGFALIPADAILGKQPQVLRADKIGSDAGTEGGRGAVIPQGINERTEEGRSEDREMGCG